MTMKKTTLVLIVAYVLILAACFAPRSIHGKDMPEAEFNTIEYKGTKEMSRSAYSTRYMSVWYDRDRRVSYVVITEYPVYFIAGYTMKSLIRK